VREFAETAFGLAGLDANRYIVIDPELYRPAEVHLLVGNPSKARATFGWKAKTGFHDLISEMLVADCASEGIHLPLKTGPEAH